MLNQIFNFAPFTFLVNGNGISSVCFHKLHTWHIGQPIAYVYHVSEGNRSFVLGSILVQIVVIGYIQDTFVNPEKKLRFCRVIYGILRPTGHIVFIIQELTGEDLTEIFINTGTFNNFPQPDEIIKCSTFTPRSSPI